MIMSPTPMLTTTSASGPSWGQPKIPTFAGTYEMTLVETANSVTEHQLSHPRSPNTNWTGLRPDRTLPSVVVTGLNTEPLLS
jgi:hypothetical protein